MHTDATPPTGTAAAKQELRSRVLERRERVPSGQRAERDRALLRRVLALTSPGQTVCAYVPDAGEAGGADLPCALAEAGCRVLLPVPGPPGPMPWACLDPVAGMRPGRFGIPVPVGEVLPPETVAEAALVLVPALAVDRTGHRLGRGAGYYDRTLPFADPDARLVAVLDQEDLLQDVPAEGHDHRLHGVVTPDEVVWFPAPSGGPRRGPSDDS